MLPHCLKLAALALVLGQSMQVLGQWKCSPCSLRSRTVSVSKAPPLKKPAFVFNVSLQSYSPARSSAPALNLPSTPKMFDPYLHFFQSATNAALNIGGSPAWPWFNANLDTTLPPFLTWLHGFHMDRDGALFRPFQEGASRFALAYSDIFETHGDPDKGGHGLSILFRYDFGKNARLLQ